MNKEVAKRLSVYTTLLVVDLACWYGILHVCGVV